MNTLILTDNQQGQARAYLAKHTLETIAAQHGLSLVTDVNNAELVIIIGDSAPDNVNLHGKKTFAGSAEQAIREPDTFISHAKNQASVYQSQDSHHSPDNAVQHNTMNIVAITACPTGVAHTFMAAKALETEAQKRDWQIKVETRGSVGTNNAITRAEIVAADVVIVAADIDVDLTPFSGKRLYRTSTGAALKKTAQELDKALTTAEIYSTKREVSASNNPKPAGTGAYQHLMTGVSYMLPMVVAGGLCIALSFVFGIEAFKESGTLAAALMQIGGGSALSLMVPVLSGYIAYSIAGRTGLAPGLVGGMLAVSTGAGFLGGIISGFLAGYIAMLLTTRLRLPQSMEALKPILIIPLVATLVTGLTMIYIVGNPVAAMMEWLTHWLKSMGTTNAVILGAILGGMMCTDMGGPVNKAAYAFGVGLLSAQTYGPMAAIMAAGMVPPLAMWLATVIARNKFDQSEREGGKAALVLGLCFISEGAIPFAAKDPVRVLPSCILGGAVTGALSMYFGVQLMAPHGGLFVLLIPGAITPVMNYLGAIVIGTVLTAGVYGVVKKKAEMEVVG
ncbi:PTS fructose transporter subunit IIBC [Xenorhabdus bovienii]|uniref:PTS fructose transporter subunit IIBC n=1 Tax=Xenorhabdus bovienii TaxID=40576 RepID=UPI0023B25397|nr:PTS fructose transporter subunit IIBC [Xenorhabdus bovienii]MDE9461209.1 PTS fructose transporter subunit IIBC [Xenorhabdus bovienii]MDE9469514.1 PTS fructose transporter subunit IIBC [Xenorhabdus bovienii]